MVHDQDTNNWRLDTELDDNDRGFLEDQINNFNLTQTQMHDFQWLGFVLRDASNTVTAGIAGYTWGGGCEIRTLWVDETVRRQGIGQHLLALAEREAARRGCTVVLLDTHSFQAPTFYQKQGYTVVGIVDDYPRGHQKYFFQKRIG